MTHDALIQHLLTHSVKRGEFVLKSGKRSDWFIDAKQTTCRPDGMLLVAEAALAALPPEVTAVGGLTMGADAMAFSLAVGGFVGAADAGAVIDSGAVIGCGLLPGQPLDAAGVPIEVNEVCEDWRAIWQQRLDNFDPEVAVLLTGAWDVWDRTVDGQRLVVGTPAWVERERAALDLLGAGGTPVVLGLVPCAMDPAALGGPPVAAQPDRSRIDWLNETYRQAAAAHPGQVTLVDFGELLCPDGTFTNQIDGVRMIFQNTPNTEAPREMNTYIPEMKALWMAENVTATLHNS